MRIFVTNQKYQTCLPQSLFHQFCIVRIYILLALASVNTFGHISAIRRDLDAIAVIRRIRIIVVIIFT